MIDNIKKQNEDLDFEIQQEMARILNRILKNHHEAIEILSERVKELEKKINGLVQ